jgi:hypothetical protein
MAFKEWWWQPLKIQCLWKYLFQFTTKDCCQKLSVENQKGAFEFTCMKLIFVLGVGIPKWMKQFKSKYG